MRLVRLIAGSVWTLAAWSGEITSSRGVLESEVAMSPADFGAFSNALIVGNFGDGQIHAYDAMTGRLLGELKDESGKPSVIDGLWGITFGNGAQRRRQERAPFRRRA